MPSQTNTSTLLTALSISCLLTTSAALAAINPADIISAADGNLNDTFGWSVAIDGNTAIVGAYQDDGANLDTGSAYI